jgi:CHAT domain-containing protein/Flp pilus assembly protein TadD
VNPQEIIQSLVTSNDDVRTSILHVHSQQNPLELAYALKDICYEDWQNNPAQAKWAASALTELAAKSRHEEIDSLNTWCEGLVSLSEGKMEFALEKFEATVSLLTALNNPTQAAFAQSNQLVALAMLGRYDEAIDCGLKSIAYFESTNETTILGKLNHNIGNLFLRRNDFQQAEPFFHKARLLSIEQNDDALFARVANSLALLYSSQNRFREAEQLYAEALPKAETTNQITLQADIEANIGELALFQGRYDHALDYLERARRRFVSLGVAQRSALAELEIADAYLELNLKPEANTRYEKLIGDFVALGMRAEQARVFSQQGRALLSLGDFDQAKSSLEEAQKLYIQEGNPIGAALTDLTLAQLYYEENEHDKVLELTNKAEEVFMQAGTWRFLLTTRWLRGEAERAKENFDEAEILLNETLENSKQYAQPQTVQRCLISLGLLKIKTGETEHSEDFFKQAIDSIENLRSPLPGEEFRTAFFSDKLTPYNQMVRLCLDNKKNDRAFEALGYVERSRSRALADNLSANLNVKPRDDYEAKSFAQTEALREELNWYYSQLNCASQNAGNKDEVTKLNREILNRENLMLEIMRRIQQRNSDSATNATSFNLSTLQKHLGKDTALIEYANLEGEWIAFILTGEKLNVVRSLGNESETVDLIEQFYFQIGTLRHGAQSVRQHLPLLTKRIQNYLNRLYSILIEPLKQFFSDRRLAIVPHRALHYVPFHALYDGKKYLIEEHEICYAPSAVVLEHSLSMLHRSIEEVVLFGVADERAPQVRDEINSLAQLFKDSIAFLNEEATIAALKENAPRANLLHLACHGQFRQDNPTFSTLRLGDGWLTVHDASRLNLNCELVTLSACETGVNLIAPGDELIGLSRGFFSAGTPSLLLSLWPVDDEATKNLMTTFYKNIQAGRKPVDALRQSQLKMMNDKPHPFFWSPFVLIGRWT